MFCICQGFKELGQQGGLICLLCSLVYITHHRFADNTFKSTRGGWERAFHTFIGGLLFVNSVLEWRVDYGLTSFVLTAGPQLDESWIFSSASEWGWGALHCQCPLHRSLISQLVRAGHWGALSKDLGSTWCQRMSTYFWQKEVVLFLSLFDCCHYLCHDPGCCHGGVKGRLWLPYCEMMSWITWCLYYSLACSTQSE